MYNGKHSTMILVGGWCLILFAILFVGLTIAVDILVKLQPMLYGQEQHNLFKVASVSPTIRTLLTIYAVSPLLLIPGAVAAYYTFIDVHEANMRVGMYFATAGALALSLSLMMLPSFNTHLVSYIQGMPDETQKSLIVVLASLHSYFGVFVGDLLGYGCLFVWFFITSFVMLRDPAMPRAVGVIELIITIVAAIVLAISYMGIIPDVYSNVQAPAIAALWIFICGVSLVSLRR